MSPFQEKPYPVDIAVLDIEKRLTDRLKEYGFERISWEAVHPTDREYLQGRDQRSTAHYGSALRNDPRSVEDYLLYENDKGTLAYIRPNPKNVTTLNYVLPFEIHFRTAAPEEFLGGQYYSLAPSQEKYTLLRDAVNQKVGGSIRCIVEMEHLHVMDMVTDQLAVVNTPARPIHLYHSVYLSRNRNERDGCSNREKAIEDLSVAMHAIIVSADLFSTKQLAYYQAAADIDKMFLDGAIVR